MGLVLETEVRYGIFDRFRGSLLLWKRIQKDKTPRISYGDRTVPSWSWMAYSGGISFISVATETRMVPRRADLCFSDNGEALNVKVRQFSGNCRMEQKGEEEHAILEGTEEVGSLWFDVAGQVEFKYCVVVSMDCFDQKEDARKTYYVLAVRKKDGVAYERLGVGKVEAQYVSRGCNAGTLV